jgi:hypothetical protein
MAVDRYESLLGNEELTAATTDDESTNDNQDLETTDADTSDDAPDQGSADATDDADADESPEDSEAAPEDAQAADVQSDPYLKDRGDERTLPKWAKELIKEKPELAASLKALHFGNQRYSKFGTAPEFQKYKTTIDNFGGIDKVLSAKSRLDSLGGESGLDELQAELTEFRALDKDWNEQPSAFIDRLIQNNAENYSGMMPTALVKWAHNDFQSYAHVIAQATVNTLAQNGTLNGLDMVNQALATGNIDRAKQIMAQVTGALEEVFQLSQKAPAPRVNAPDPAKQKFETERKQFAEEKMKAFDASVQADNNAWLTPDIKKEFGTVVKGKQISDNLFSRLDDAVRQEIGPMIQANPDFQKQRNALRAKGDRDGVVRLWKQHASPLIPKAVRNVAKSFDLLGNVSAKVSKTNGHSTATDVAVPTGGKGFTMVKDFPKPRDVDRNKTTEDMIDRNEFVLFDGRKVKVRF